MSKEITRASNVVRASGKTERLCRFEDTLWTCQDGRVMRIGDMETRHLFNSMKMIFNHLASMWGGEPVWFTKQYGDYDRAAVSAPQRLALQVVQFCALIEKRGDLPVRYHKPYAQIRVQMKSKTKELPNA